MESTAKRQFTTPDDKKTMRKYETPLFSEDRTPQQMESQEPTSSSKSVNNSDGTSSVLTSLYLLQSCIDECSNEEDSQVGLTIEEGSQSSVSILSSLASPIRGEKSVGMIRTMTNFKLMQKSYRA